jgi:hypothetical protein
VPEAGCVISFDKQCGECGRTERALLSRCRRAFARDRKELDGRLSGIPGYRYAMSTFTLTPASASGLSDSVRAPGRS